MPVGAGSLPVVFAAAAANDTITFAQDCTGANPITLTSTLTPTVNVTIDATAPLHAVTISGGNNVGLFRVNSGTALGLRGLTLANGNNNGSFGGAIFNGGTVNVAGTNFSGNAATSGGAIYNLNGGVLNVAGGTFSGNSANGGFGGVIFNSGVANVEGSTFSGNSASNRGGAIYNDIGTVNVTNGTFSGNSAPNGSGGAIYNLNGGTVNVAASTFSGNAATSAGGAIFNAGTLQLALSIVAGNNAPTGPDISGTVTTDGGGNVVGNMAGSMGLVAMSDRLNVSAMLNPLSNNGGPVQTFSLMLASPAIDIAACPTDPVTGATLTTDARGVNRPQGMNCDAGSYEALASPQTFVVTRTADTANDANCNEQRAAVARCGKHLTLRASRPALARIPLPSPPMPRSPLPSP